MCARNQVNTGCYHGCRVDESTDRSGALHGIWQPHIEWQLCRFRRTGDKEAQGDDCLKHGPGTCRVKNGKDAITAGVIVEVQCAILFEDKENSDHEAKVTYDVDDQGFLGRRDRSGPAIPETNQEE